MRAPPFLFLSLTSARSTPGLWAPSTPGASIQKVPGADSYRMGQPSHGICYQLLQANGLYLEVKMAPQGVARAGSGERAQPQPQKSSPCPCCHPYQPGGEGLGPMWGGWWDEIYVWDLEIGSM